MTNLLHVNGTTVRGEIPAQDGICYCKMITDSRLTECYTVYLACPAPLDIGRAIAKAYADGLFRHADDAYALQSIEEISKAEYDEAMEGQP